MPFVKHVLTSGVHVAEPTSFAVALKTQELLGHLALQVSNETLQVANELNVRDKEAVRLRHVLEVAFKRRRHMCAVDATLKSKRLGSLRGGNGCGRLCLGHSRTGRRACGRLCPARSFKGLKY